MKRIMFSGRVGEGLVILVVILIVFGAKNVPEMMKNIAKGIRVFRTEISKSSDTHSDVENADIRFKNNEKNDTDHVIKECNEGDSGGDSGGK